MDFTSIFKMSNETYDKLKYVVQIILPAIATFVGLVSIALGWDNTKPIMVIFTGVITLLGTILGISNHNYKAHD